MPRFVLAAVLSPFAAAVALTAASGAAEAPPRAARTPAELTAEDFFRPPAVRAARLNLAGTHAAMMVFEEKTDSTGLGILDLTTKRPIGLRGTQQLDVYAFQWAGNEKIVFSVSHDNLYASGLYVIPRDRPTETRIVNELDGIQVLGAPLARPDDLFVWVRQTYRDNGRPGSLLELDLQRDFRSASNTNANYNNIVSRIAPPPGDGMLGWLFDRSGEVRYAIAHKAGAPKVYRRGLDAQWTALAINLDRYRLLGVDLDPNILFVARRTEQGLRELVRLNTLDGTTGPVLHADDKYDFSNGGLVFSGNGQDLVGLAYTRRGPIQIWLREEEAALQAAIDAALPAGRINRITDRSRDGSSLLVTSSSDRHPGTLYLFKPKAQTLSIIAETAPWLPESLLSPMQLMNFKARDGLSMEGYVTLPLGYVPGKPSPMIVLPHGGPWVRDVWGFNPEAQFFASRGYVVFQPNYRGSSGYNAAVSTAPRAEFRRMHDDVTDGTRALIKAGIADPAHIAIVGGSFGGYLAVCGAAFEPELYRCAVTIAGVFDWESQIRNAHAYDTESYRYDFLMRTLGDPRTHREQFEAMSPINAAAQIHIPVFIAHGGADNTVDASQSHRLAKILAQAGVPCETMFEGEEGHGFSTLKNRVELYRRIESFLKKHL